MAKTDRDKEIDGYAQAGVVLGRRLLRERDGMCPDCGIQYQSPEQMRYHLTQSWCASKAAGAKRTKRRK